MGIRTHQTLVSEALELAGNTGLTTRAQGWLIDVLEKLYSTRHWPFLIKSYQYTLSQGVSPVALQTTGLPLYQRKLYDLIRAELFFNGQFVRELDVLGPKESPAYRDGGAQSSPSQGLPLQVMPDVSNLNAVSIGIYPPPDKAYVLNLVCHSVAASELVYNDVTVPVYPNDRTIMQGILCEALRHQQDERQYTEEQLFEKYAADDVAKYAAGSGYNQKWQLDKKVYGQPSPRYGTPWGWMGPQ